ncbi:Liver glycogen synthase 2 [Dirofilaria immitis]|nr:Liver glycogen synthase 2 [Dirofilaria immitis]
MEPNSMEYWVALLYSTLAVIALLVLSVVDLISVLPVPFLVVDIFRNEWPFGIILCKLMYLCEGANKSLSPLLLTALSIDRCIAVRLPMLLSLRQPRFACFVLFLCFTFSLFFIIPILYHSEVNDMLDTNQMIHAKCTVEMSRIFDVLQLLFCYVTPLFLICTVYVVILHRLYRHTHKNLASVSTTNASYNSHSIISLSHIVKSSALVVAFYFICWTPYWVVRFFTMFQDSAEILENTNISQHNFPLSNHTLLIATKNSRVINYPELLGNDKNNPTDALMDSQQISTDPNCKDVTVIAFIIYPAAANSFNVESLKGQAVCKQLHDTVSRIKENLASRMFEACLKGRIPEMDDLLLPDERIQLKRCILNAKRDNLPPICTHNMLDDACDPVLNAFRRTQLINQPFDRVKVIFHPEFLSSVSPLMNLDYEDFVRGCHMGVFPSYYEPWGYTPAECTVMGVPSVTTNLSGFGCFIQEQVQDPHTFGIFVIDRRFKEPNESIDELAKRFTISHQFEIKNTCFFCRLLSRRQRIIMRNRTERLSELIDWKTLGTFYREARRKALEATHPNFKQVIEETVKKMSRPNSAPSTPTASRCVSPYLSDDSDTAEQEEFEAKAWADAN